MGKNKNNYLSRILPQIQKDLKAPQSYDNDVFIKNVSDFNENSDRSIGKPYDKDAKTTFKNSTIQKFGDVFDKAKQTGPQNKDTLISFSSADSATLLPGYVGPSQVMLERYLKNWFNSLEFTGNLAYLNESQLSNNTISKLIRNFTGSNNTRDVVFNAANFCIGVTTLLNDVITKNNELSINDHLYSEQKLIMPTLDILINHILNNKITLIKMYEFWFLVMVRLQDSVDQSRDLRYVFNSGVFPYIDSTKLDLMIELEQKNAEIVAELNAKGIPIPDSFKNNNFILSKNLPYLNNILINEMMTEYDKELKLEQQKLIANKLGGAPTKKRKSKLRKKKSKGKNSRKSRKSKKKARKSKNK